MADTFASTTKSRSKISISVIYVAFAKHAAGRAFSVCVGLRLQESEREGTGRPGVRTETRAAQRREKRCDGDVKKCRSRCRAVEK